MKYNLIGFPKPIKTTADYNIDQTIYNSVLKLRASPLLYRYERSQNPGIGSEKSIVTGLQKMVLSYQEIKAALSQCVVSKDKN